MPVPARANLCFGWCHGMMVCRTLDVSTNSLTAAGFDAITKLTQLVYVCREQRLALAVTACSHRSS